MIEYRYLNPQQDLKGVRIVSLLEDTKQKTAYEISACLVGSEMCIRDSSYAFQIRLRFMFLYSIVHMTSSHIRLTLIKLFLASQSSHGVAKVHMSLRLCVF